MDGLFVIWLLFSHDNRQFKEKDSFPNRKQRKAGSFPLDFALFLWPGLICEAWGQHVSTQQISVDLILASWEDAGWLNCHYTEYSSSPCGRSVCADCFISWAWREYKRLLSILHPAVVPQSLLSIHLLEGLNLNGNLSMISCWMLLNQTISL